MSYINFSAAKQSFGLASSNYCVTMAFPEGGEEYSTAAIGEEGGDQITSLAVGEEGGGTTWCGNEGGGWDPPASTRTQDYLDFMREADARGGFGFGDGKLTRDEASKQIDVYQRQIRVLDKLSSQYCWYNPQISRYFDNLKDKLEDKVQVGNRLLNNFTQFARGGGWSTRPGDDPNTVSTTDIQKLSRRDGNPYNISDTDLGIVYLYGNAE